MQSNCPICDGQVNLSDDIEETEILTCSECNNRIVVESVNDNQVSLAEAPPIEEDWGQ